MKKRVITSVISALIGCYLSCIGTYNLHLVLTGNRSSCTMSLIASLQGLAIASVRNLFFLLFGLCLLFVIWMVVGQSYIKYKSDMYKVTPDIHIPKPEGQGQYGTAWFLDSSKFNKAFAVAKIDQKSQLIQDLIEHGYDDLKEE